MYHESRTVSRKGIFPPTGENMWGMCGFGECVVPGGYVWFWGMCGSGGECVFVLQKYSCADQSGLPVAFERTDRDLQWGCTDSTGSRCPESSDFLHPRLGEESLVFLLNDNILGAQEGPESGRTGQAVNGTHSRGWLTRLFKK
jgi:hypothetical protein